LIVEQFAEPDIGALALNVYFVRIAELDANRSEGQLSAPFGVDRRERPRAAIQTYKSECPVQINSDKKTFRRY
jgi:hypothetical protein